jgi:DsbC/DsbD-like thiol-disulfide interchange protein
MCCGRDCNPGVADLSITLPVKDGPPEADARWASLFHSSRQSEPKPLIGWKAEATREGDHVLLKLTAESAAAKEQCAKIQHAVFFTTDGYINPDKGQQFAKPQPDVITFALTHSEYDEHSDAKQFGGVLTSPEGWRADGQEPAVSLTVPVRQQH